MKFRYNLVAWSLLGALMASCDPMDDIYSEIDAKGNDVTKTKEEYVLTQADYESISKAALEDAGDDAVNKAWAERVKTDLALNSFATADKYVPGVLRSLYPSWGEGSTVGVTYDYQEEPSELVKQFMAVSIYGLTNDDYKKIWGEEETMPFLSPKHAPETVLPGVLKENLPDAAEGAFAVVDYKYDEKDPEYVQGADLFSEDFSSLVKGDDVASKLTGWKSELAAGSEKWTVNEYSGDLFAEVSAYGAGGKVDNWLITPAVNITSVDAGFTFNFTLRYYKGNCLSVYVSDSYAGGAFVESDWKDITSAFNIPEATMDSEANAGTYALADYNGKTVYFAFRYQGEDNVATTTVRVDDVKVTTSRMSPTNEMPYSALYQYDGSVWKSYSNEEVVLITPADYDAMGNPGSHDNFSSSDKPENYLPQFMAGKYPYAQQGDSKVVLYKFYDSSSKATSMVPDEYVYTTAWAVNKNIVTVSKEGYIFVGGKWMFSPIVPVVMAESDYQILQDWVQENHPGYIDAKYKNSEYWFGGSTHYLNFNTSLVTRRTNDPEKVLEGKSDEEAEKYLISMVAEGMKLLLETRFPNAEAQQNGADVYYEVSAQVYDGGRNIYTFSFKSLGGGQFELSGEPEIAPV